MSSIIQVENLSKKFVLTHENHQEKYVALRDVISKKAKKIFSFSGTNLNGTPKNTKEEFWALKDLSFEINEGDRVGIIGRNGAGKSTLLKILSRITEPTTGRIVIEGRIASLLEVGTGFHPELTGRENIFLNGAILGMSRQEIRRKFDEIVDFSGVEMFLDTPVKRYSSGMYVRLAFAVAAHLEPEILVIDEVLAVGDAEFQKKCLGKMDEVSKSGRTVLFVSHQMGAIAQLCQKVLVLKQGQKVFMGDTSAGIAKYLQVSEQDQVKYVNNKELTDDIYVAEAFTCDSNGNYKDSFGMSEDIGFEFAINVKQNNPYARLSCTIQSKTGEYITTFMQPLSSLIAENSGSVRIKVSYPAETIVPNFYFFRLAVFIPGGKVFDLCESICPFTVTDEGSDMAIFEGSNYGYFATKHSIEILSK
jgi:lipopolysaccharide transport system ATP-binding protein